MSGLRKQFEALPEIKRIVSCDGIKWCNVYIQRIEEILR